MSATGGGAQRARRRQPRGEPTRLPLDDLVQQLLPRLAPRLTPLVLAEIARLAANAGAPYSTRRHCAPPGWTDEGWRAVAASIPGTYRPSGSNGKPGRWLVTPRSAYDAWATTQGAAVADRTVPARPAGTSNAEPWHPRMAAEALGLRLVRRPR